jgi:hypothetical protein
MSDKVAAAIETLRTELGFSIVSVWAPGHLERGDVEVTALFFAKTEDALMAGAIALVTEKSEPS